MINKDTISKMKKGVRIVNCARGGIINEQNLRDAIESGQVASAAIDVYENEPNIQECPLIHAAPFPHPRTSRKVSPILSKWNVPLKKAGDPLTEASFQLNFLTSA